jgi:ATP-dependent helicase/nuclease subunit A
MNDDMLPAGEKPHRRILASAGCGKTYSLAGRFLELVHRGAEPRTVWASTFSRAAAAEIRDRVLRKAAAAAKDEAERADLARAMSCAELDRDAVDALLGRLVEALPHLEIRTLDSLFAGITKSCAAELGLPVDSRMLEEGEGVELLRAALRRVLDARGADAAMETLTSLALGRPTGRILGFLEGQVRDLLTLIEGAEEGAWDWDEPKASSGEAVEEAIGVLRSLGSRIEGKRLQNAVLKDASQAQQALAQGGLAWGAFLTGGLSGPLASGRPTFYGKPIPEELVDAYEPLLETARAACIRAHVRATHAARDFARLVQKELEAEKLRRGVQDFADLTRALDPDRGDPVPLDEVWFRIDNRAMHLLLDEFQDTSAAQWRAVRQIAGQIALTQDGTRSLFAVGDVKQSIYGWRGGEPRILDRLREVTAPPDEVQFDSRPLNSSYRSSRSVIDAVNAAFQGIERNPAVLRASPEAGLEFGAWFDTQRTTRGEVGFATCLDLPSPDEDESKDDVRVRVAVARARAHWLRLRERGGRVAILVRRNSMVGRLVAELKRIGVPTVGRGGGSLRDTEANLALLQTLHLAAFPDDRAAAHDLATSPLRRLVGLPQEPGKAARRQASARLREAFAARGAAAVFDEWRRALDADLGPREAARMRQLVEAAERLERGADRTPHELLGLLSAAKVDDPGHGAVAVLNIHQSKGLEYDVVIVTDLGGSIVPDAARQKLVSRASSDPAGRLVRVSRSVGETMRWPEVEALHEDEKRRAVREALCVLYVALTRARDGLEVHLEAKKVNKTGEESSESARSLAAVCREAFGDPEEGAPEVEGCRVRWACGETPVGPEADVAGDEVEQAVVEVVPLPLALQAIGRRRTRRARAASRADAGEERERIFELPPRDALERGHALHAALELVGFLGEDPLPGDEAFDAQIESACPGRDRAWRNERLSELHAALEIPAIRDALARPWPGAELRREHAFLRVQGGAVQEGAIDRLVLERDSGGRVVRAEVMDFKSGSTAERDQLEQRYGDQLRAYRDAVVEQFDVDPAAVRLRILALGAGVVVDLG